MSDPSFRASPAVARRLGDGRLQHQPSVQLGVCDSEGEVDGDDQEEGEEEEEEEGDGVVWLLLASSKPPPEEPPKQPDKVIAIASSTVANVT